MKILNLYAGLGGNRHLWGNEHEITAVDTNPAILIDYGQRYPSDRPILRDATTHLLTRFDQYDFTWSSPPCQSHSRMLKGGRNRKPRYVDMALWQQILFCQQWVEGYWCIENVIPSYGYFIPPTCEVGRHALWANFPLEFPPQVETPKNLFNRQNLEAKKMLEDWLGIGETAKLYYNGNHDPTQVLRNCVHPEIGKWVLDQVGLQISRADLVRA